MEMGSQGGLATDNIPFLHLGTIPCPLRVRSESALLPSVSGIRINGLITRGKEVRWTVQTTQLASPSGHVTLIEFDPVAEALGEVGGTLAWCGVVGCGTCTC
jgi:hypothetical protein